MGTLRQRVSLNTFWSIVTCLLTLGLHGYALNQAHQRYQAAASRFWPGCQSTGGHPRELTAFLALLVLSALCLPFFLLASCLRIGNHANDGVKLGRDHALQPDLTSSCCCCCSSGGGGGGGVCCSGAGAGGVAGGGGAGDGGEGVVRRGWRTCLPLAQTLQVTSAFLLLLPHTLLTAVEVAFGYKTSEFAWTSDVDFLFPEERAHLSDVKASLNKTYTMASNGTLHSVLSPAPTHPTHPPPPGVVAGDHSWVSLAFINFLLALLAFSIRYAAVFWYTNKALTLVFALQLLTLTLTAALGFSAFSCLYKVCRNQLLFLSVRPALSCPASLALYLLGSAVMLLSTLTLGQYGALYFGRKMRIIERRHHQKPEGPDVSSPRHRSGETPGGSCQGYAPHTCALLSLALLAACKGPVLYELVRLYRPTQDGLVLVGLVSEAGYMVLWVALWFALTVKQQWQFRILDYVSLGRQSAADSRSLEDEVFRASSLDGHHLLPHRGSGYEGFDMEMDDLGDWRGGGQNRDSAHLHTEPPDHVPFLPNGGPARNDLSKQGGHRAKANSLPNGKPVQYHILNPGGQLITVDMAADVAGQRGGVRRHSFQHLNVQADVHDSQALRSRHSSGEVPNAKGGGGGSWEKQHKKDGHTESFRDYRNSIRSKCDDLYTTVDFSADKSAQQTDSTAPTAPSAALSPQDALPTLMSSFRDKVKESSRAANSYRQQRCSLKLGQYGSLEKVPEKDPSKSHSRNGSWTPQYVNTHGSLERDSPGKDLRTHTRNGSWTPQYTANHHGSQERVSAKDGHAHRTHTRSGSWTHPSLDPSHPRIVEERERIPPIARNAPKRPRPASSQSQEGADLNPPPPRLTAARPTHKSHSLPHSRQRQPWHNQQQQQQQQQPSSRGRPRNNSLPSPSRRPPQHKQQQRGVSPTYSVQDQMARLRSGSRESVLGPSPSPRGSIGSGVGLGAGAAANVTSRGGSGSGAAPLPGSRRLQLPSPAADLASCPFMTSRATSTND